LANLLLLDETKRKKYEQLFRLTYEMTIEEAAATIP
jgi:hypothetical protein